MSAERLSRSTDSAPTTHLLLSEARRLRQLPGPLDLIGFGIVSVSERVEPRSSAPIPHATGEITCPFRQVAQRLHFVLNRIHQRCFGPTLRLGQVQDSDAFMLNGIGDAAFPSASRQRAAGRNGGRSRLRAGPCHSVQEPRLHLLSGLGRIAAEQGIAQVRDPVVGASQGADVDETADRSHGDGTSGPDKPLRYGACPRVRDRMLDLIYDRHSYTLTSGPTVDHPTDSEEQPFRHRHPWRSASRSSDRRRHSAKV